MDKTIKVSEDGYKKLNSFVGYLRSKEKKPVSMNEALLELLSRVESRKIEDFAGSWTMDDKEAEKIKKDIKRLWKTWKLR